MIRILLRGIATFLVLVVGVFLGVLAYGFPCLGGVRVYFYKALRRAMGVKQVQVIGQPFQGPCVVMSNHISYIDIPVLGSLFPCRFVSKEEVRSWPFVGWIARGFSTIFVSRKTHNIHHGIETLRHALTTPGSIVLFPEGTTGDGCRILPCKPGYFHLPLHTVIQPVSLQYICVNGVPASWRFQKRYSYRGDVTLFSHALFVWNIPSVTARVIFHPSFLGHGHRKDLAKKCFSYLDQGTVS